MEDHLVPIDSESGPNRIPDKAPSNAKNHFEMRDRRRRLKAARKGMRRNLRPKPPRRKNWALDRHDGADDAERSRHERIMPIDEGDRRHALEQAAFRNPDAQPGAPSPRQSAVPGRPGTVITVSSGLCTVERDGVRIHCRIKTALTARETAFTNAVAVGDQVIVRDDGGDGGIIEDVLPRRTALTRPDVFHGHRRQVVVANADQILIVSSWREPFFWPELVDRCLIAALRSGLRSVVCMNKSDLAGNARDIENALQSYQALGHRTVKSSGLTGEGVAELADLLRNRTTVLTGLSGTGKSSLISAVQPDLRLRTSQVITSRKRRGEGRHTTTQSTMHRLEAGGFVVDTPGIREFGLSGLRRQELAGFFPEIAGLALDCRFSDCAHLDELGCAVRAGEATGSVPASRYHSYRLIHGTLPE